jgi:hypothetical protein
MFMNPLKKSREQNFPLSLERIYCIGLTEQMEPRANNIIIYKPLMNYFKCKYLTFNNTV